MKSDELKKVIRQIRKYDIEDAFDTPKDFDKWIKRLSAKQINNFINLTIDPNEIHFPTNLLLDGDLLNCDDYSKRIDAMAKLKNADGWYHLFDNLCSPNFLNSENYYEDMEMISKAPSAQYLLWVVNDDVFINSPYHKEDLKLIVEAKDTKKEDGKELDWLVAEALVVVARNADSVKGPYHREDMQLIAHSGSECLQSTHSFPESSLNNLATNKVSLKDKYHLENMQILAQKPAYEEFLYELMTNPEIIKGKHYRDEVKALANAKSLFKATAMYFYISPPNEDGVGPTIDEYSYRHYNNLLWNLGLSFRDTDALRYNSNYRNSAKDKNNSNYLKHLELLNQVDDKFVLYIESLLSNKTFANSKYFEYDLNVLLSTQDKDLFIDLYNLMSRDFSINESHHIKDLDIIRKADNKELRRWLISEAINKYSINSYHHDHDMEYISKLDLDNIDRDILKKIHYYLFIPNGINHPEHIERLEKLAKGEPIQTKNAVSNHLDYLENNPDDIISNVNDDIEDTKEKPKAFSRIRRLFNKR